MKPFDSYVALQYMLLGLVSSRNKHSINGGLEVFYNESVKI